MDYCGFVWLKKVQSGGIILQNNYWFATDSVSIGQSHSGSVHCVLLQNGIVNLLKKCAYPGAGLGGACAPPSEGKLVIHYYNIAVLYTKNKCQSSGMAE